MMISRRKIISKSEDSSVSSSSSSSSSSESSSSTDNLLLYNGDGGRTAASGGSKIPIATSDRHFYRHPHKHHYNSQGESDPYSEDGYSAGADGGDQHPEQDENIWTNFDQLVYDQLEEIRNKWNQIDDEIWAKIICFERNRRVAKAYARSQVISITGSERGFDGYRIGLNGFPNPKRDFEIQLIKQQIRTGFKLKMDDLGNIHIKRVGRCPVFCIPVQAPYARDRKSPPSGQFKSLELNKPRMIFDFKSFQHSMIDMLSSKSSTTTANHQKPFALLNQHRYGANQPSSWLLQNRCVHCIQVVFEEESRLLRHPCWILLINIVALDLLWSKFKSNRATTITASVGGISRRLLANEDCRRSGNGQQQPHKQQQQQIGSKKNPLYDPDDDDDDDDDQDDYGRHARIDNRDLYYCGYMAKISNHSDRHGVPKAHNNTGAAVRTPPSSSSSSSSAGTTSATSSILVQKQPKPPPPPPPPPPASGAKGDNSSSSSSSGGGGGHRRFVRNVRPPPNPMRQLPTFNRIGLAESKRLFFSSHQLSFPGDDDDDDSGCESPPPPPPTKTNHHHHHQNNGTKKKRERYVMMVSNHHHPQRNHQTRRNTNSGGNNHKHQPPMNGMTNGGGQYYFNYTGNKEQHLYHQQQSSASGQAVNSHRHHHHHYGGSKLNAKMKHYQTYRSTSELVN